MYTVNIDWLSCTVTLNDNFYLFELQKQNKQQLTPIKEPDQSELDKEILRRLCEFSSEIENEYHTTPPDDILKLMEQSFKNRVGNEFKYLEQEETQPIDLNGYALEPVKGTAQYKYGFDVYKDGRKLLKFLYGAKLQSIARTGQIFIYNDLHYIYYKKYSEIITEFCDAFGLSFKNWCRVDICRDNDKEELFCGKSARDFMRDFMDGKLRRLAQFNKCRPSGIKEQTKKEVKSLETDKNTVQLMGSSFDPYQTLYFNSNHCNISAKIYNKTRELRQNYKSYIYDHWVGFGMKLTDKPEDDIFRFEISMKNFGGRNSDLMYNGQKVGKSITIFDDPKNTEDIFNNVISTSYRFKESYYTKNLFENVNLSYNLYYVDKKKVIKDCLNITSYTVGVKNYLDKLGRSTELNYYLTDTQKYALLQVNNILNKIHSSRFQDGRAIVLDGCPVSNTGQPKLNNNLNYNIFSATVKEKLNQSPEKIRFVPDQYFVGRMDKDRNFEIVAGLDGRKRDLIINLCKY